MPNAPRDASHAFRDEELLADVIAGLIGDARHVAIGASSPIPAAAGPEEAMSGAAANTAIAIDLVQTFILAIPTLLHCGAIASPLVQNG